MAKVVLLNNNSAIRTINFDLHEQTSLMSKTCTDNKIFSKRANNVKQKRCTLLVWLQYHNRERDIRKASDPLNVNLNRQSPIRYFINLSYTCWSTYYICFAHKYSLSFVGVCYEKSYSFRNENGTSLKEISGLSIEISTVNKICVNRFNNAIINNTKSVLWR